MECWALDVLWRESVSLINADRGKGKMKEVEPHEIERNSVKDFGEPRPTLNCRRIEERDELPKISVYH